MTDYVNNLTLEDFQRYLRVALQWIAAALVTRGVITPDAAWVEPVIGVLLAVASFAWTLYANRLKAKIEEVVKAPEVKKVVTTPTIAAESPSPKVQPAPVKG